MRFHLVRGTKRREEAGRSVCVCILTCQTPNTQGAHEQSCDGCMWVTLITWLSSMHLLSEQQNMDYTANMTMAGGIYPGA